MLFSPNLWIFLLFIILKEVIQCTIIIILKSGYPTVWIETHPILDKCTYTVFVIFVNIVINFWFKMIFKTFVS